MVLATILSLRGIKAPGKRTLLRALTLWASSPASVDFVDALSVAQMEQQKLVIIASFDADFDRFRQIKRQEP